MMQLINHRPLARLAKGGRCGGAAWLRIPGRVPGKGVVPIALAEAFPVGPPANSPARPPEVDLGNPIDRTCTGTEGLSNSVARRSEAVSSGVDVRWLENVVDMTLDADSERTPQKCREA